jgi:hypothetical protein
MTPASPPKNDESISNLIVICPTRRELATSLAHRIALARASEIINSNFSAAADAGIENSLLLAHEKSAPSNQQRRSTRLE